MTKLQLVAFNLRKIDFQRWRKVDDWPASGLDWDDGIELLTYLWTLDRKYSVTELSVMVQARFELSRGGRMKSQLLFHLKRMHRTWCARERAGGRGEGFEDEQADLANAREADSAGGFGDVAEASAEAVALAGELQAEQAALAGGVAGKKLRTRKAKVGEA